MKENTDTIIWSIVALVALGALLTTTNVGAFVFFLYLLSPIAIVWGIWQHIKKSD